VFEELCGGLLVCSLLEVELPVEPLDCSLLDCSSLVVGLLLEPCESSEVAPVFVSAAAVYVSVTWA
jgi:hypothetical protein